MAGNPFHDWLGLDPKIKNPHHFQLLGVSSKVTDSEKYRAEVTSSAKTKLSLLKKVPADANPKLVAQLKARIKTAHEILSNDQKRAEYVSKLKSASSKAKPKATSSKAASPAPSPAPSSARVDEQKSKQQTLASANADLLPPASGEVLSKPVAIPAQPSAPTTPAVVGETADAGTVPIPLAVPIPPSSLGSAPVAAVAQPAKEVAVNLDGVPIDDVKIDRRRKKKSKSVLPKVIFTFMLLAGIGGAVAVYMNWEQLLQYGGLDPDNVALGPNGSSSENVESTKKQTAADNESNSASEMTGDETNELSDVDLDKLEELDVDAVMGHAATVEVIGEKNTGLKDRKNGAMSADSVKNGKKASAKTKAAAMRPTKSLEREDVLAIKRRVGRARRSLLRSDEMTASAEIKKAAAVLAKALGDEFDIDAEQKDLAAVVAGTADAIERLAGFRRQVIQSSKGISGGQEIESGGNMLGFVEATDDVVILKNAGSLISYDYQHLRPGLAMALGEQGAIPDIPTWRLQKAAMYGLYTSADSDNVDKAGDLISLSEEDGHDGTNLRNFVTIDISEFDGQVELIASLSNESVLEMTAKLQQDHGFSKPGEVERDEAASLAEKLIGEIPESQMEQAAWLSQARKLAVRGLNAYLVEDAIVALDAVAKINAAKLSVDSYASIAKQKLTPRQARKLMETAIPFLKSEQAATVNERLTNRLAKKLMEVAKEHGFTDSVLRIKQID